MTVLDAFHFLRPTWLLAFLPAAVLLWIFWHAQSAQRAWRGVIAPHLLASLLVSEGGARHPVRPVHLVAVFWTMGIIALAGPTWKREPAPFAEDQAALIIALKVTPTMLAKDVQPSRLERAVHKIRDLLDRRPSARTALIAYSGSAHLVLPLTRDAGIIETFAADLSPNVMPVEGDAAADAVRLANDQLDSAGLPGSILLMADSVSPDHFESLQDQRKQGGVEVHVYAVAAGPETVPPADSPPAPALDNATMERAARAGGGTLTQVTVDERDVEMLAGRIARSVSRAAAAEGERWQDGGYTLVPPVALLVLLWFRRGWKLGVAH